MTAEALSNVQVDYLRRVTSITVNQIQQSLPFCESLHVVFKDLKGPCCVVSVASTHMRGKYAIRSVPQWMVTWERFRRNDIQCRTSQSLSLPIGGSIIPLIALDCFDEVLLVEYLSSSYIDEETILLGKDIKLLFP